VSVKVLVLVLSVDREPWRSIERDGQRATWAAPSNLDDAAPVRFYRGKLTGPVRFLLASITRILLIAGSDEAESFAAAARRRFIRIIGHHWHQSESTTSGAIIDTDVPETYAMVTTKLFTTLTHVLATEEFDYLFRTNSSTYVDRRRLIQFAQDLPRSRYWGGFTGTSEGITFTSGAGTLMSRDCVADAVTAEWDWSLIDDVALSRVLTERGFEAQPLSRPTLSSVEAVTKTDLDGFMWRCKGEPERDDVEIMRALQSALETNR